MNLATGDILAPFLDKALCEFDEPWEFSYEPKGSDDAWHPSGDCTPDVLHLFEKATRQHEKESRSGSLLKSFMVGHFWHQWIQHVVVEKLEMADPDDIERTGLSHWGPWLTEDPWPTAQPYHWVTGKGDIAPLVAPKWTGVVDIKTMSSHQFKTGQIPSWAKDKYKCQINIYMDLFDQEHGMILAVNKDAPHDFKEFTYERDDELIEAIYRKWKYVSHLVDNNQKPTEEDEDEYRLPL